MEAVSAARLFLGRDVPDLDKLLLTERLLSWSNDALERDLEAYPGVSWQVAARTRDLLLRWLQDVS